MVVVNEKQVVGEARLIYIYLSYFSVNMAVKIFFHCIKGGIRSLWGQ